MVGLLYETMSGGSTSMSVDCRYGSGNKGFSAITGLNLAKLPEVFRNCKKPCVPKMLHFVNGRMDRVWILRWISPMRFIYIRN